MGTLGSRLAEKLRLSRTVRVMRVKHKRGIKREKIPGDSKRVVPRIMSDPSRNMRDHVPGLLLFKFNHKREIRPVQKKEDQSWNI